MDKDEIASLYKRVEQQRHDNLVRPHRSGLPEGDRPMKHLHGLTRNQYKSMKAAQAGFCFICKKKSIRLVLDHDHKSGKPRKFLCDGCNIRIGQLESGLLRYLTFDQLLDYLDIGSSDPP